MEALYRGLLGSVQGGRPALVPVCQEQLCGGVRVDVHTGEGVPRPQALAALGTSPGPRAAQRRQRHRNREPRRSPGAQRRSLRREGRRLRDSLPARIEVICSLRVPEGLRVEQRDPLGVAGAEVGDVGAEYRMAIRTTLRRGWR